VNVYGFYNTDLKNIRVVCMCLLCYAGFLRFAELANLRRHHVFIYDNHVKLFLESSKTGVYREGRDVLISKTNTPTCPVNMLLRYFYLAEIPADSTDYIFRPLCFCKSVNSYTFKSGKLSYTTARKIILSALETLGLSKKYFGLHSLRSGGATAIKTNREVMAHIHLTHISISYQFINEINNTFIGTAHQCAASSIKQRKELKDQYFE
jgi:integrase